MDLGGDETVPISVAGPTRSIFTSRRGRLASETAGSVLFIVVAADRPWWSGGWMSRQHVHSRDGLSDDLSSASPSPSLSLLLALPPTSIPLLALAWNFLSSPLCIGVFSPFDPPTTQHTASHLAVIDIRSLGAPRRMVLCIGRP